MSLNPMMVTGAVISERKAVDINVEAVRELLFQRSEYGLKKYGKTTDQTGLPLRAWLQHALEETLDKAVYLTAAIREIDEGRG